MHCACARVHACTGWDRCPHLVTEEARECGKLCEHLLLDVWLQTERARDQVEIRHPIDHVPTGVAAKGE